jgi:exopolysaccharide biosynthesis polyprenyl glycosylphosphotransferase
MTVTDSTLAATPLPPALAVPAAPAEHTGQKETGRSVAALLALADAIALVAVLPLAVVAAGLVRGSAGPALTERPWAFGIALTAIPFLAIFGLYNRRWRISEAVVGDFRPALLALSLHGFLVLQVIHAAGVDGEASILDGEVFALWLGALLAILLVRGGARRLVIPRLTGRQRTVIVGAGQVGQSVARKLQRHPELNLDVVGFVDTDPQPLAEDVRHVPVLGPEERLVEIIRSTGAQRVIITFSRTTSENLLEIMRWSDLHRIYVTIVPRFFEVLTSNVDLDDINGIPVLDLRPVRFSRGALLLKRATDLTLTLLSLPILAVLFAAIAAAIKLDSRGPVFFRQPRMGRGGRVFRIVKFRTMVVDAEARRAELLHYNELTGPLFKIREDPRVTRVGRFLRRTSLDELPQLINVVRGEMSLVGPRPFVTYEDREITGWARRRLDLTPGITGLWQVMGRNDVPFEEMVKLDYLYVTRWSVAWDIKLLLQTIPVVLRRRGAY